MRNQEKKKTIKILKRLYKSSAGTVITFTIVCPIRPIGHQRT